jgi:cytochrome c oxidase assembly protein subunit 15
LPHIIGAFVVLFLAIWTGRTVRVRFGTVAHLRRWGILLTSFIGTQFLLGIAAYWAVVLEIKAQQPTTTYVILTVAHVLVGALTLAASVVLALSAFRAINGNATVSAATKVAGSRAEGSRA